MFSLDPKSSLIAPGDERRHCEWTVISRPPGATSQAFRHLATGDSAGALFVLFSPLLDPGSNPERPVRHMHDKSTARGEKCCGGTDGLTRLHSGLYGVCFSDTWEPNFVHLCTQSPSSLRICCWLQGTTPQSSDFQRCLCEHWTKCLTRVSDTSRGKSGRFESDYTIPRKTCADCCD